MGDILELAKRYRGLIDKSLEFVPDEALEELKTLHLQWNPNGFHYIKDKHRFVYKDELYGVRESHISQLDWTPDEAHSLYKKIVQEDPDVPMPWQQTIDGYAKGFKVTHLDHIWKSVIDNNVWEPGSPGIDERYWIQIDK